MGKEDLIMGIFFILDVDLIIYEKFIEVSVIDFEEDISLKVKYIEG